MTAFTIGMLAAALWLVAIVAVILLTRRAPGPASRSMREFRTARRTLVPSGQPESSVRLLRDTEHSPWRKPPMHVEAPPENDAPSENMQGAIQRESGASTDSTDEDRHEYIFDFEPPSESEDPDLNRVLKSITSPDPIRRARSKARSTASSKTPARIHKGPRKSAGISYILVDETGKPLL